MIKSNLKKKINRNGFGLFTWGVGNYYKGNYFLDQRHGYGEIYWTDGSYYKGKWEQYLFNN